MSPAAFLLWRIMGAMLILSVVRFFLDWCRIVAPMAVACLCWVATCCLWIGPAQADDERRHVLLLFSNDSLLPANDAFLDGFRGTMETALADKIVLFPEYLDAARFSAPEHEAMMRALLQEKYAATRIDLVLAIGPQSLKFLAQYQPTLFPNVPVLFAAVSEASLQSYDLRPNASGIVSRFDPAMTVDLALRLQPDTVNLVVVTGASEFDKQWEATARGKLAPYESRLKLTYLAGLPLPALLQQIGQLPPRTAILFLSMIEDGTGSLFTSRDVAERIAGAANAPVYGVYSTYLGRGIVGGYIETFEAMGDELAHLALRTLAGEKPQVRPADASNASKFMVDWRQLRRWGLSEANLPADTVVGFREQSLWDQYRVPALTAVAVVLVQSLLIAGLLLQARRRRRAEASLRESDERTSLVAESTNLGFWQLEFDGYRIWANDTCRALLGLDPVAPLDQQSFANACHPDDRRRAAQVCNDAVARGASYDLEYRVVGPDGRVRWILDRARTIRDTAGKPLHMTGVVIDITDRKQAEAALRESEERYRNVVETQTELICRYLPDTTLTFVNDAYCRYFERSPDQLVGTKFVELIPRPARATILQRVESLTSNPHTETYEHEVLRPDGSTGWQQWVDRPILASDGRVIEIQGIGRDVTELRRAELEAQERRQEVTHLTRVAILGELSGALAHELSQPLTAILSNAQAAQRLLAKAPVDLEELRNILADIGSDDKRAGEVINRLRALLRKGEANLQALDINDLATEVLELAHSEFIERNVAVTTRLTSSLPGIRGDHVQLEQVLLNLIMNACEAMADNNGTERVIEISTGGDGNGSLQLSVVDRGPGIPPEMIDRIFEPFTTTKTQGLGLGLSICRSIISAHGGHLWAANNPDRGATFAFTLPAHPGGQI